MIFEYPSFLPSCIDSHSTFFAPFLAGKQPEYSPSVAIYRQTEPILVVKRVDPHPPSPEQLCRGRRAKSGSRRVTGNIETWTDLEEIP